ncbi:gamma-glutamyl-gamma-aminobutyrate hydrolase family protein [Clostridium sp. Cult2]|uniref:gamma-glutamyl-gamma-aminobutyrate hydrolase family protein n=1 Tax=Clostridium sp. Cult2 TaxID=2079003 RepID=UPI001F402FE0|nr:gamma-glutamyl-gamma-aminobutyrate hydrolase family protein [Clostridium sp. Cult2]MCF6465967.1 peptidase C26 [Clostridium sp. Cult2]
MKPLIGITTYYVKDRELGHIRNRGLPGQDMLMSTMDYSKAIEKAGGIPVALPVIDNDSYINQLVKKMDGFLFTGGSDIHPNNYHESVKKGLGLVVPERDAFELKLLKRILEKDKPILGICRGFQLINVYFGGKLYQDIKHNNSTIIEHHGYKLPKYCFIHNNILEEGSKIYEAFGKRDLNVNSLHHQIIEKLGEGLLQTVLSEDGIIEGFEHKNYSYVVGMQWHPEMMFEVHSEQLLIFKHFINNVKALEKSN